MDIRKGRAWAFLEIIPRMLLAGLDPTTFVRNAPAYALYEDGTLASFCAVKTHGSIKELGNVYTKPAFRGRGHSTRLLQHVIEEHPRLYLFCLPRLIPFYERLGFRVTEHAPEEFGLRRTWMRFLALLGKRYMTMERRA